MRPKKVKKNSFNRKIRENSYSIFLGKLLVLPSGTSSTAIYATECSYATCITS